MRRSTRAGCGQLQGKQCASGWAIRSAKFSAAQTSVPNNRCSSGSPQTWSSWKWLMRATSMRSIPNCLSSAAAERGGVIAVVDDQRLAGVADDEPVVAAGFGVEEDVVGHLVETPRWAGVAVAVGGEQRRQVLLQAAQRPAGVGEYRLSQARHQGGRFAAPQGAGGVHGVPGAGHVVVVVLEGGDARHPAGGVDGLAAEHHLPVHARQRYPEPDLGEGAAGQGDHLHLQAGQPDAFVVAQQAGYGNRLDRGEQVPQVVVDDVGLPRPEMLPRIGENGPLVLGHVHRDSPRRGRHRPGGVVAEVVGQGEGGRRRRELGNAAEPAPGAGIDYEHALASLHGVDVAAVLIAVHTRDHFPPVHGFRLPVGLGCYFQSRESGTSTQMEPAAIDSWLTRPGRVMSIA